MNVDNERLINASEEVEVECEKIRRDVRRLCVLLVAKSPHTSNERRSSVEELRS